MSPIPFISVHLHFARYISKFLKGSFRFNLYNDLRYCFPLFLARELCRLLDSLLDAARRSSFLTFGSASCFFVSRTISLIPFRMSSVPNRCGVSVAKGPILPSFVISSQEQC